MNRLRPRHTTMPGTADLFSPTYIVAAIVAALSFLFVGACAPAVHRADARMGGLDARAIVAHAGPRSSAVSTGIYRSLLTRSLYSRCQMFPSDSELFDRRARVCGATSAAVLGVARLLLEVEASPEVLPVTFADRRIRWLDWPQPSQICAP